MKISRASVTTALFVAVALLSTACAGPPVPAPDETDSTLKYVIVDTAQMVCYNNSSEIAAPAKGQAFYGQDAQHSGAQPSYRDNGDGTVTDLNTGLVWQQDPGGKMTYASAIDGASSLRLGRYNDWRLPTIKELYSLILFSGIEPNATGNEAGAVPFIDTRYFVFEYGDTSAGERVIDAQYWSATEYVSATMNGAATVFGVNFADGRIKGYPRDIGAQGQPAAHFVRYVRGNPDYGANDFLDNGDETVADRATGLMWARSDSGAGMDWEAALAWVERMNREKYLGYSDWRLPNAKELQSIVNYSRSPSTSGSAALDPVFEITSIVNERGEVDFPFFWTSTTHSSVIGSFNAVYISFGRALGLMNGSWLDVHGAGAQRSDPKAGAADQYPSGRGPQGDAVRILNFVRLVRDA